MLRKMGERVDDHLASLPVGDWDVSESHETTEDVKPALCTDKKQSNEQTEAQHNDDLGRHDDLEHVVDLPADQDGQDDKPQADISDCVDQPCVFERGWPVEIHRRNQHGRIRGKPRDERARLSIMAMLTQNPGPGFVRIKPVNTGSPVYRAYRPHSTL